MRLAVKNKHYLQNKYNSCPNHACDVVDIHHKIQQLVSCRTFTIFLKSDSAKLNKIIKKHKKVKNFLQKVKSNFDNHAFSLAMLIKV